jgi:hypothetical protein
VSRASAAGVTWTSRTAEAEWAARAYHTSVIDAAGAIYVIGGRGNGAVVNRDVWVSTDGGGADRTRAHGGQGVLGGYDGGTKGLLQGLIWGTQGYYKEYGVLNHVPKGYRRALSRVVGVPKGVCSGLSGPLKGYSEHAWARRVYFWGK